MINPGYKARWRPTTDLGHHYDLDPNLLDKEEPPVKSRADALAVTRDRLYELLMAHGDDQDLLLEETAREYPDLFPEVVITPEIVPLKTPLDYEPYTLPERAEPNVVEQCTRADGAVDWNRVARATIYVASSRSLTPSL